MTLFQRRHFEWLARWAAANLTPLQADRLARDLAGTNAGFKLSRFAAAVEKARAPDVGTLRLVRLLECADIRGNVRED